MNKKIDEVETPEEVVEEPTMTPEEELEKVKAENATLLQTKENLVSEIKDIRSKKQLTEKEKEELASKLEELEGTVDKTEPKDTDVFKKVEELLNKKEQQSREKNRDKAMNKFLAKHPEFSASNDEAGLRKSAFEKKLSMFNTGSLEDEDDFLSIYEDAYRLLGRDEKVINDSKEVINNPLTHKEPKKDDPMKLSPMEIDYINKHMGGNEKRYKELKTKNPDAIRRLLASESNK